jgi:hypothetical protein
MGSPASSHAIAREDWPRCGGQSRRSGVVHSTFDLREVVHGEGANDAGQSASGLQVDLLNPGVWVRRAHDRHVQHARQTDVLDVVPASTQQWRVFAPPQRSANQSRALGQAHSLLGLCTARAQVSRRAGS